MGKPTADSLDLKSAGDEGTIGSATAGAWVLLQGPFNFTLSGTFDATSILERSFDGGVTAHPLTRLGETISFTVPCSEVVDPPELGVLYRVRVTAYVSGSVVWRLSK